MGTWAHDDAEFTAKTQNTTIMLLPFSLGMNINLILLCSQRSSEDPGIQLR